MQPMRVSFEAARTTAVVAASDELHSWFADQLGWLFGPAVESEFERSRSRLLWPPTGEPRPQVEAGLWRARFDDLLADRPDRGEPLLRLVRQARYALLAQPPLPV
jgi:hypothetical protein